MSKSTRLRPADAGRFHSRELRRLRTWISERVIHFPRIQRLGSNDDFESISRVKLLHQDRHVIFDSLLADL